MSLEGRIDAVLKKLAQECGGDLVDHTSKGLRRFFPNKGHRLNPCIETVGLLNASCPEPNDLSQSPSCRFPNINNNLSKGLDITEKVISFTGKVADITEQAYIDEIVGYLGPIGTSVTVVNKAKQLVKWTKTRAHLLELRIIYELATEAEAPRETLEAISYAVDQKEKKKNRSGIQGLVPLLNTAIKAQHRFKNDRGKERSYYANVLARNSKLTDPWAKWTVRCLVVKKRSGYGIEQLMKELEKKLQSW